MPPTCSNLHGLDVQTTLPPELATMDSLQILDLGFINMAWGTVPSSWIQAGAFPSLKVLDLSNAYLDGFGSSWYAQAKLGGLPAIQNLLLYNPFSDEGQWGAAALTGMACTEVSKCPVPCKTGLLMHQTMHVHLQPTPTFPTKSASWTALPN